MKSIDDITDLNDAIVAIEAHLAKNRLDKEILIREAFILWYVLVEGINCEDFTEKEIEKLLKKNYTLYQANYIDDADYNFIVGWMIGVAFWYFDPSINEEYGTRLLFKAYRSNSKNSLFKWGVRNDLNLRENEINNLRIDISLRLEQLYNYGPLIKEYFLSVINTHTGAGQQ